MCPGQYAVPPDLMAAIVILESYGDAFYCKCDSAFSTQSKEVEEVLGPGTDVAFVRNIMIGPGMNSCKIPKFKIVNSVVKEHFEPLRILGFSRFTSLAFCCNIGLAGKNIIQFLLPYDVDQWVTKFDEFIRNPHFQAVTLADDLMNCLTMADGDFALAAQMYNSGVHVIRPEEYGVRVAALHKQLSGDKNSRWCTVCAGPEPVKCVVHKPFLT